MTTVAPLRPPMDPRIRERRIAVRRADGRRRLRRLLAAGAAVAVAGLAAGAAHSPLLDVDRLVVRGADRVAPGVVRDAAGVAPGTAMVAVDQGAVAARVRDVPWVATVAVHRHWPGTVELVVTERTPVATVAADGDRTAVVDGTGRVLAVAAGAATSPDLLPRLEGLGPPPPPGGVLTGADEHLAVARAFPPALVPEVAVVTVRDRRGRLALRSGAVVELGELAAGELTDKLVALATLLERVELSGVREIDVGVPDAPVVRR